VFQTPQAEKRPKTKQQQKNTGGKKHGIVLISFVKHFRHGLFKFF
jgi:hypothetical protein